MRVLVTGTAGFIGFHLADRLIADGAEVYGVDGMTPYYDVRLKEARHAILKRHTGFSEHVLMLEDAAGMRRVADLAKPDVIVHLAAQAGVRYSIENPRAYVDSNLVGTFNVLQLARSHGVGHLLLASTSSVYGANTEMPAREIQNTAHPLTLYAATKKATEEMSHSYSHLWNIPTTACRFFTAYGPWGRPDMAPFKFVKGILEGEPIDIYNDGRMERDFTYIDDVVEGIVRLIAAAPEAGKPATAADSLSPVAPWRVVNIGRGEPVNLLTFVEQIEKQLGKPAHRNYLPMQAGDVAKTFADVSLLKALTGYTPGTSAPEGIAAFCGWYLDYYRGL